MPPQPQRVAMPRRRLTVWLLANRFAGGQSPRVTDLAHMAAS